MKSLMNKKTKVGLSCNFNCTWEYERHNPLGMSGDTEKKALFLFERLVELEKSDVPPFKDIVISFIELLQERIGRLYLSEHIRTLDFDLGVVIAKCTCFEWLNELLHLIGSTTQDVNNKNPKLFSVYDENAFIDASLLQKFCCEKGACFKLNFGIENVFSKECLRKL